MSYDRNEVIGVMPDFHTVVIARPGHYRTSLVALLASIAQIGSVKTFDSVNHVPENASGLAPDLVLLEVFALDQDLLEVMDKLAAWWPGARKIIVAEHIRQPKPAGFFKADFMLTKNVSTGEFLGLVERLLVTNPAAKKSLADPAMQLSYSQ